MEELSIQESPGMREAKKRVKAREQAVVARQVWVAAEEVWGSGCYIAVACFQAGVLQILVPMRELPFLSITSELYNVRIGNTLKSYTESLESH
jgi:hypothetical protein